MNYKTTYILFGILIAILLVVSLTWWIEPVHEEGGHYLLPSANSKTSTVKSDDVVKVQIERARPEPPVTIVFERDDQKNWGITTPLSLRADPTRINALIGQVLAAQVDPKADVPADLKAAELDPPAETVTLTTKDGKELKINAGAESPLGSSAVVYLTSNEKPQKPIPVRMSGVDTIFKPLAYFRDAHLLASATSDYRLVKLELSKVDKKDEPKGALVLIKKKDDAIWEYKDPAGYDGSAEAGDSTTPLDPTKAPSGVDPLVRDLADLQVESTDTSSDWVEDDPKDLAKYNLDPTKADLLTINIDRAVSATGDETTTMTLKVALKKVDDKTDKYYALIEEKGRASSVVKISTKVPDAVALLFKDPTALCNHSLVALGAKAPLAVDVVNESGKLQFRREKAEDPWKLYRNDGKDELPVDQTAVGALVNQLVQPNQVRAFLDPKDPNAAPDKTGLNKPVSTVFVWTEGVQKEEVKADEAKDKKPDEAKDKKPDDKKEEPKPAPPPPRLILAPDKVDKPAAKLTFGNIDGDLAFVQRDATHTGWSESAVVKAPKLIEEQAKAGPLAYYDKKLPQFTTGFDLPDKDVIKLEMDRDGVHYVISRADPAKQEWKFEEPKDWATRKVDVAAVEGVLAALNGLRATSLVTEAPKDEDLDKVYGLTTATPPPLKVVVTKKDDKNSPYTFTFGKDAPDGVYGRQNQRPMVFVVSKADIEPLKREFRDRTIFAFDAAKVKTLHMVGWLPVTNVSTVTLDFERKDDKTWTLKGQPDKAVASDKLNKFVDDLSKLQADRFVPAASPVKTEFDKEDPKRGLAVEVKVDGVDAPYALKVVDLTGDMTLPEADRQVYATSPQAPGELFQVNRSIFKAATGQPEGLIDTPKYLLP